MNEFDHRPDRELGDALRDLLSSRDDAAFVARVMGQVPQQLALQTPFSVLGEWARPGLAAAAALLVAATVWMSGQSGMDPVAALDETIVAAESLSARTLLASEVPDFRLEMVMGEERVNE